MKTVPPALPPKPSARAVGSLANQLWKPVNRGEQMGRGLLFSVLGGGVTLVLATMLYGMVRYRDNRLDEDSGYKNANFIRLKEDSAMQRRTRQKPKKQIQKEQPKTPTMNVKASTNQKLSLTSLKIDVPDTPAVSGNFSLMGGPGIGSGTIIRDSEFLPFARVKPIYPPEAHDRGIEGWVDVVYTVTERGTVSNPKVVKAHPPSVFNRAALDCVKKWKYRPRVKDGKPVRVPNVTTRVSFDIRDAE